MSKLSAITQYNRKTFAEAVKKFNWRRRINQVHMHHTWSPDHKTWKGEQSQNGMWNYHTKQMGWGDIAQHVTIAPDGIIWGGRDWNASPASSSGYNGSGSTGPFMFEMAGNFDTGHDVLRGPQLLSAMHVTAMIMHQFKLPVEALKFHRHLGSPKTCPGSGVDYETMLGELQSYIDSKLPNYL